MTCMLKNPLPMDGSVREESLGVVTSGMIARLSELRDPLLVLQPGIAPRNFGASADSCHHST